MSANLDSAELKLAQQVQPMFPLQACRHDSSNCRIHQPTLLVLLHLALASTNLDSDRQRALPLELLSRYHSKGMPRLKPA